VVLVTDELTHLLEALRVYPLLQVYTAVAGIVLLVGVVVAGVVGVVVAGVVGVVVAGVVGVVVPDTIMFKVVLICCVPSGLSHSP